MNKSIYEWNQDEYPNSSKPVRKVHNFWNHIHFHPTDAIEDQWGRDILNKVAEDKAAQYVRMYNHTMFEDMVTKASDGCLVFDFSQTIREWITW